MMPIPTHLKECLKPFESQVDEETLKGSLCCTCGNNVFTLFYQGADKEIGGTLYPIDKEIDNNYFFIIKAKCNQCQKEYEVFDSNFHGWDGYICHNQTIDSIQKPSLVEWKCHNCGYDYHTAVIEITSQGKEDFIEETNALFDVNRWMDAFDWFSISIECCKCGNATDKWVDYETM